MAPEVETVVVVADQLLVRHDTHILFANQTKLEQHALNEETILQNLEHISEHGAYRHYRPLKEAANEYIKWAETPQLRVYTGIRELDKAMRGTAPGELTLIQGFTHSGKTLLATDVLMNNEHTPIILFTPDETRPLVLTKLASALHEVDARTLERRIQQDDATARDLLLETAAQFGKLAIFDEAITIMDMDRMFDEVIHAFGERPKAVMFDYADLLAGYDDVRNAITALKMWGKKQQVAMFVLHQTSRSSGASGRKIGIDSGSMGGEMQATHVVGVRRKKYMHYANLVLLEEKLANATNPNSIQMYESKMSEIKNYLIPRDENTVTVNLVKNKRPPCDLIDDLDFAIDPNNGRISRQEQYNDPNGNPVRTTKAALKFLGQHNEAQPWEEQEMF